MVINELRVFREVDNRARDGKLVDNLQDEIRVLREELRLSEFLKQQSKWSAGKKVGLIRLGMEKPHRK